MENQVTLEGSESPDQEVMLEQEELKDATATWAFKAVKGNEVRLVSKEKSAVLAFKEKRECQDLADK